ncbi:MAG: hypothetical protein BWY67_02513 [Bacteroidetes bacterium ADurb.Bin397]|nr:MAG: hypothetical protein BWY67_02513 [Bacteroidetes bacterium ADurb.Bin397]
MIRSDKNTPENNSQLLKLSMNDDGAMPNCFLKDLLKALTFANPVNMATSDIGS